MYKNDLQDGEDFIRPSRILSSFFLFTFYIGLLLFVCTAFLNKTETGQKIDAVRNNPLEYINGELIIPEQGCLTPKQADYIRQLWNRSPEIALKEYNKIIKAEKEKIYQRRQGSWQVDERPYVEIEEERRNANK